MAPTPSKPVPPAKCPRDKRHTLTKYYGFEKMWCEWCDCNPCRNIKFEEEVMDSDECEVFCHAMWKKYFDNLKSDNPCKTIDWTPKRYISKIRFWHYERYAKFYGLAWGYGQDAQLPRCIKAKIRMTFRQPAQTIHDWIQQPYLYQVRSDNPNPDPFGTPGNFILGKRSHDSDSACTP